MTSPLPQLSAVRASIGYGDRAVVHEVDLAIPPGRISVIVGANASGKSTLLKAMARLLTPSAGSILLDGRDVHRIPTRELARTLGLLPQAPIAPDGVTVVDLVGRGRHPHRRALQPWTAADTAAVDAALAATGTTDLADREVDELSGGQRQRAWIALALAQQPDVLLLDEPTTYLDIAHQIEVLDLLTDLNRDRGTTIVMVLHDLNLAARYADVLFAVRAGRLVASGAPAKVLTAHLVAEVFGLHAEVVADPVSGTPFVVPRGRHHAAAVPERAGAPA